VPVAGHAIVDGARLRLEGLVGAPDGSRLIRDRIDGEVAAAAELGRTLADRLLAQGAGAILAALGITLT
jgi:hydroxymethylbilane synthase